MLDKEIDATEYKAIKSEYESEIGKMDRKIDKLSTLDSDLKEQVSFCCDLLQNLPKYFVPADLSAKQQIRETGFWRNFISSHKIQKHRFANMQAKQGL